MEKEVEKKTSFFIIFIFKDFFKNFINKFCWKVSNILINKVVKLYLLQAFFIVKT